MLKEEIAENREKMKEQSKIKRFKYFWYYHWKPVLLGMILICCIISYVRHFIEDSKEPSIYVAMVNCNIIAEEQTDLLSEYALSRNIDTKTNPTRLDVNLQMAENRNDNLDVANSQKLSAFLESGDIDIILAPQWVIEACASQAYFENIEAVLPDDLYQKFEDKLIYYTYEDDGRVPIAIYAGDIEKISSLYDEETEPYLAIGNFSARQDTAVDFLRYLLDE